MLYWNQAFRLAVPLKEGTRQVLNTYPLSKGGHHLNCWVPGYANQIMSAEVFGNGQLASEAVSEVLAVIQLARSGSM